MMSLGQFPTTSLVKANSMHAKALLDLDAQIDPGKIASTTKKAVLKIPTVKVFCEIYVERYAKKHKKTWKEDEAMLNRDIIPVWGNRKIHSIKKRDILEVIDGIVDRGAPISANRTFEVIRKMFNWAIERDYLEHSPYAQVKKPAKAKQRDRVLSTDEIKSAWKQYEKLSPDMGAIFKLLLLTAQRKMEILSINKKDLDLKQGWWTIPAHRAKNGLSHRVHLSNVVIQILEAQLKHSEKKESDWLFPSPTRKNQHISSIQKAHDRVKEGSEIDNFRVHDLRRTAASNMASAGVPRLHISKVLNHVDTGITRVYDRHSYDNEKKKALNTWSGALQIIVN